MDGSIDGRARTEPQAQAHGRGQPGEQPMPGLHQTCCRGAAPLDTKYARSQPMHSAMIGESLCNPGVNIVRLRVDEAHRYARDHVLERGAPPQGDRACP